MGKKEKTKVDINGTPLESVTIGEIKENKHGWIGTLALFILFFGVVFALPYAQKLYQKYFGDGSSTYEPIVINNTVNNTVNNTTVNNTINDNNNIDYNTYYKFENTKAVEISNLTFNNIKLSDGKITFIIKNNDNAMVDLSSLDLSIDLFDKDNKKVSNLPITDKIGANGSKSYEFDSPEGVVSFNILVKTSEEEKKDTSNESTQKETSKYDDNYNGNITCTKNNNKIVYTFENGKLIKILNTDTVKKDASDYSNLYTKYSSLLRDYKTKDGITCKLSVNKEGFTYTMDIDYNVYESYVNHDYYYGKGTTASVVSKNMNSNSFTCN